MLELFCLFMSLRHETDHEGSEVSKLVGWLGRRRTRQKLQLRFSLALPVLAYFILIILAPDAFYDRSKQRRLRFDAPK